MKTTASPPPHGMHLVQVALQHLFNPHANFVLQDVGSNHEFLAAVLGVAAVGWTGALIVFQIRKTFDAGFLVYIFTYVILLGLSGFAIPKAWMTLEFAALSLFTAYTFAKNVVFLIVPGWDPDRRALLKRHPEKDYQNDLLHDHRRFVGWNILLSFATFTVFVVVAVAPSQGPILSGAALLTMIGIVVAPAALFREDALRERLKELEHKKVGQEFELDSLSVKAQIETASSVGALHETVLQAAKFLTIAEVTRRASEASGASQNEKTPSPKSPLKQGPFTVLDILLVSVLIFKKFIQSITE